MLLGEREVTLKVDSVDDLAKLGEDPDLLRHVQFVEITRKMGKYLLKAPLNEKLEAARILAKVPSQLVISFHADIALSALTDLREGREILVNAANPELRKKVATSFNAEEEFLVRLANDPDPSVVHSALRNLRLPLEKLDPELVPLVPSKVYNAYGFRMINEPSEVRRKKIRTIVQKFWACPHPGQTGVFDAVVSVEFGDVDYFAPTFGERYAKVLESQDDDQSETSSQEENAGDLNPPR